MVGRLGFEMDGLRVGMKDRRWVQAMVLYLACCWAVMLVPVWASTLVPLKALRMVVQSVNATVEL